MFQLKPSISIIITALNEERHLVPTVDMILRSLEHRFSDYELLVFDDGSQDRTREIADKLAMQNDRIRVIHNASNLGVGYCYREGIILAEKEYTMILPGDGISIYQQEDIENIFDVVGKADFVLVYISDDTRSRVRRWISQNYVRIVNLIFGLRTRYVHGPNIYKSEWAKQVKKTCDGIVLINEVVIRSIKAGQTYVEIGLPNHDQSNSSQQLRLDNFVQVIRFVFKLWWELEVASRVSRRNAT